MTWFPRWVAISVLVSGNMMVAHQASAAGARPETEPNGTTATATPLHPVGGGAIGSGTLTAGDLDIWSFTATAGARVWILTDTGGTQDAGATSRDTVIDLLAADGTTVIENDDDDGTANGGDGTMESGLSSAIAGRTLTAGGQYFIRVHAFSVTAVINPYRVFVSVTTTTPTAEVEPDDTFVTTNPAAASAIGVWSGAIDTAADQDVYSIVAEAGDSIFISADADPSRGGLGTDLVVELRSPDAATLILSIDSSITGSMPNPATETANFSVLTSGTYVVVVRHFSATGTGPYHLMLARVRGGQVLGDFDGEGQTDIGVYRDRTGEWFIRNSGGGSTILGWGGASLGDVPAPADYDGDGRADIAVYRDRTGEWFLRFSGGGSATIAWGGANLGDTPVPADYDGDGQADIAVYRDSTGEWFIRPSHGGMTIVSWGGRSFGDAPVPGDYDGDGLADIAVYRDRTGEWFIRNSRGGSTTVAWGGASFGDTPVPGDFDGDGKTDIAVYRGTTGEWFVRNSGGGSTILGWGGANFGDMPVPGDYDGDGLADIAVYRGSTGEWFVRSSAGGTMTLGWGAPGDIPLTRPSALR